MNILLNGEAKAVSAETVAALVEHLGLDTKKVALERNREIVPRAEYAVTTLMNGDEIEIVEFIGGG